MNSSPTVNTSSIPLNKNLAKSKIVVHDLTKKVATSPTGVMSPCDDEGHEVADASSACNHSYFVLDSAIEPKFEYQGYYNFGQILGRGSFGTVIECFRKSDNKAIALKFFKRKAIHKWTPENMISQDLDENIRASSRFFSRRNQLTADNRLLPSEVACLIRASKLDGVVRILDYLPPTEEIHLNSGSSSDTENESSSEKSNDPQHHYNDEAIIGIVLERNSHEQCFFNYLMQQPNGSLDEDESRLLMRQVVEISLTLLKNGILHGDLKSENMLIDIRTKKLKLIDFGSAEIIDVLSNTNQNNNNSTNHVNKHLSKCQHKSGLLHQSASSSALSISKAVRTFRGTNLYKPPEYLLHHCFYPRPSTVWTFGVILFDMVCGHFPFENDVDVLAHQNKEIIFPPKKDLSENIKDLLKRCLSFYVADRIVIEKILTHPWMKI